MHYRLQKGDTLENKYVILKQLGEGGMGVVYQCRHVDLNKIVAVKVLLPFDPDDTSVLERFKVEARSSASIKHVNVVEVFDYGITPDGRPFFVMEYLEGESLASVLDRNGRMNERDIVDVIDQVLTGLGSAHKRKIIHRDLKPENVFLTRNDDGRREVKILDFGIAKITGVAGSTRGITGTHRSPETVMSSSKRLQTEKGIVMGTPGYMAPETLNGQGAIDTRADLYAVGVILYEMLTGRLPFSGDDPARIMMETAHRPVPSLRAINPKISEPMEQLCLIALSKDPADRFQNTQEFIAYLSAAAVGRYPDGARKCRTRVGMPSVIPPASGEGAKGPYVPPKPSNEREMILELEQDDDPPPRRPDLMRDRQDPAAPVSDFVREPQRRRSPRSERPPRPYVGPARTHIPLLLIPWGRILFFLALAGACYYYFYYQSPFRDAHDTPGYGIPGALPQKQANTSPAAVGERVSIWLNLSPSDATVLVNGEIDTSRPLRLSRGTRPVRIEVVRAGYERHVTAVVPGREQTLTVQLQRMAVPTSSPNKQE